MFSSDRWFYISILFLSTGWMVRGLNPFSARFSRSFQTRSGTHPFSRKLCSVSLSPEVKRPGRGFDQKLPSSAEVKERVQQYLYFPSVPSWPLLGNFTLSNHIFFNIKLIRKYINRTVFVKFEANIFFQLSSAVLNVLSKK